MKAVSVKSMDFSRLSRVKKAVEEEVPREMAPIIRIDIDPYVPDDTGSLASSAFANEAAIQEGMIVWGNTINSVTGTPVNNYAQAQHDGYPNKSKARHPKATSRWDLEAYKDCKENWHRGAQQKAEEIARRTQ